MVEYVIAWHIHTGQATPRCQMACACTAVGAIPARSRIEQALMLLGTTLTDRIESMILRGYMQTLCKQGRMYTLLAVNYLTCILECTAP